MTLDLRSENCRQEDPEYVQLIIVSVMIKCANLQAIDELAASTSTSACDLMQMPEIRTYCDCFFMRDSVAEIAGDENNQFSEQTVAKRATQSSE